MFLTCDRTVSSGEHELGGDLLGGLPGADEVDHLPLARRQRGLDRPHAAARRGPAHLLDHAHGEAAGDGGLVVHHPGERAGQHVDVQVLGQEAGGADAQAEQPRLVVVRRREDEHALVGRPGEDLARRRDPVHLRHHDVHEHHVRAMLERAVDGLATVLGLRDHLHARPLQRLADHPARDRVVVDDDRPKRARRLAGVLRARIVGHSFSPGRYSTVTVFARLRGWSTLSPRSRAIR